MKKLLLGSVIACLPLQVSAAGFDGNALHEFCTNTDNADTRASCFFYIYGVLQGLNYGGIEAVMSLGMESLSSAEIAAAITPYCMPNEATAAQQVDVVKVYLADHPEKRHENTVSLILESQQKAFPCTD